MFLHECLGFAHAGKHNTADIDRFLRQSAAHTNNWRVHDLSRGISRVSSLTCFAPVLGVELPGRVKPAVVEGAHDFTDGFASSFARRSVVGAIDSGAMT
jgi:hypothetical protein